MKQKFTSFSKIYDSFYSKITDDMYLELNEAETAAIAQELLLSAVHKFEFPRNPLIYKLNHHKEKDRCGNEYMVGAFKGRLIPEEINILATYMVVEWLGQQLATIENTRMKYSGSDFKFTSQANHMQKILLLKKDYEREGFHLQRLYKRRVRDKNGVFHSTLSKIMEPDNTNWCIGDGWPVDDDDDRKPKPHPPRPVEGIEWYQVDPDSWDEDECGDTFVDVDAEFEEEDCGCDHHHHHHKGPVARGLKWNYVDEWEEEHEHHIANSMIWNPEERPHPCPCEDEDDDW